MYLVTQDRWSISHQMCLKRRTSCLIQPTVGKHMTRQTDGDRPHNATGFPV